MLLAAPMMGAPPDNIGAKRLAEGGVPASGAGSGQKTTKPHQPLQDNGRSETSHKDFK